MSRLRKTLVALLSTLLLISVAYGVESRKVIRKVTPTYPSAARQFQIAGVVKIEVSVAADGSVRKTKVVAGHPMLTSAAVDAVSRWRYEPGEETVETVEVNFAK